MSQVDGENLAWTVVEANDEPIGPLSQEDLKLADAIFGSGTSNELATAYGKKEAERVADRV